MGGFMRAFFLAVLLSSPMFAVLPPFAEARREIQAIFQSEELAEFIPYGDVFEELIKIDEGYLIITNKRHVKVVMHYTPNQRIGPPKFTIEFVPFAK